MERFSDRGSIPLASTTRLSLDAIRVRVLLFVLVFLSRRGHLIAEIRSDGAEPAPISRRHDAAPDSRIGFVRGQTACLAVPGVCLLRGGLSAPPTPGAFAGLAAPAGSPSTHQWACPAHTRGSFRFTTKGTKGVPGLCPRPPSIRLSATKQTDLPL